MDEKQQKLLWKWIVLEAQIKGTRLRSDTVKDLRELATQQAKIEQQILILDDNNGLF